MKRLRHTSVSFLVAAVILKLSILTVYADDCFPDWKYHTVITVKNKTATNLTNYQIKLSLNTASLISDSKMNKKGDDIRFTDSGSCTPIQYYIESGINTSKTVIWIKLPSLPASALRSIQMFYGNTAATAMSNADSTFTIFDDFLTSTLSSKWKEIGSSSSNYVISMGHLDINSGSGSVDGSKLLVSTSSYTAPLMVEANVTSTVGYYSSIALFNSGTLTGYSLNNGGSTASTDVGMTIGQNFSSSGSSAFSSQVSNKNPGNLTGVWSLAWPSANIVSGTWPGGTLGAATGGVTLSGSVHVAFGMPSPSNGFTSYEWVRARGYATVDPEISMGSELNNHNSGINQPSLMQAFSIYPNPAVNTLNIQFSGDNKDIQMIEIADMSGRVLRKSDDLYGKDLIQIDLQGIANGIYIVRLTGPYGSMVQKVAVE